MMNVPIMVAAGITRSDRGLRGGRRAIGAVGGRPPPTERHLLKR
jgi:hypothetical protein